MNTPIWKIDWRDEMSVGIAEIDEDHKHFIKLINDLNRSIRERLSVSEIRSKLKILLEDAGSHFAREEQLFKDCSYPDTETHASRHADALLALQSIDSKFDSFRGNFEWIEAGMLIKHILITHILLEDMKYAEFFRNMSKPVEKVLSDE